MLDRLKAIMQAGTVTSAGAETRRLEQKWGEITLTQMVLRRSSLQARWSGSREKRTEDDSKVLFFFF